MSKMECPHCGKRTVFEAVDIVKFRPTVENWVVDPPVSQFNQEKFACVDCYGWVTIDFRSQMILPITIQPVFDSEVQRILDVAKENKNGDVPASVVAALERKCYIGLSSAKTGKDLIALIHEQR